MAAVAEPRLDHIPGEDGWPILGSLPEQLRDPHAFSRRMVARYGPIYRSRSFGRRWIVLAGAEANELVLLDREQNFSSA